MCSLSLQGLNHTYTHCVSACIGFYSSGSPFVPTSHIHCLLLQPTLILALRGQTPTAVISILVIGITLILQSCCAD